MEVLHGIKAIHRHQEIILHPEVTPLHHLAVNLQKQADQEIAVSQVAAVRGLRVEDLLGLVQLADLQIQVLEAEVVQKEGKLLNIFLLVLIKQLNHEKINHHNRSYAPVLCPDSSIC